jgi:c-di-GMP-binding flagellar brake protein YcgR
MSSNQYHGPERRQTPRVETDLYGSVSPNGGTELRCRVLNVSGVGACAVSPRPLAEMAMVKLRLTARGDDGEAPTAIDVEAAVVRCQRRADGAFDVGLFFTRVRPEDAEGLRRIVETHTPAPAAG